MQFSWIPLDMALKMPSVRNTFLRYMHLFATECKLHSDFQFAMSACTEKIKVPEIISKTMGIYMLHDAKTVYSMALIVKRQIEGIYTPPEHRRHGYAIALLQEIYALYKEMESIYIWAAVADHAAGIFSTAGWRLCSDRVNKDGSRDYAPDYSIGAYKKRDMNLSHRDMDAGFKFYMMQHLEPMLRGMRFVMAQPPSEEE